MLLFRFVSIVLTPLVNRLTMPVGAMRSSILSVLMMTLKEARLVGVLRGDVSAVRSAIWSPAQSSSLLYSVTLAELIKCWTT